MKLLFKLRWMVIPIVILGVFLIKTTAPNYQSIMREKGSPQIPSSYNVQQAQKILDLYNDRPKNSTDANLILVFHKDKAITHSQKNEISSKLDDLKDQKNVYVTDIQNPLSNKNLAAQLITKDGKTISIPFTVNVKGKKISEITDSIQSYLKPIKVNHYITGGPAIQDDNLKTTGVGVKKTEWVTIAFVVLVLAIVFKSPIAPLVSLFGIGITYISSLSLIAILSNKFNFPISSITQSFLIMVLFGIGTDYNILLFMRFKEELYKQGAVYPALIETYKTAGKTVYLSACAVIIGFSSLFLSGFSVFRSAGAISVACLLLMIVTSTFIPACLAILGNKLFWPFKKVQGHKENKFWRFLGKNAISKPILFLVLSLIVTLPNALLYNGKDSYDTLSEVNPHYDSIKGYHLLQDAFSPGKAAPTTFVLQYKEDLSDPNNLAMIDSITEKIADTKGVKQVYSATRPKSEKIDPFYVKNQSKNVSNSLGKGSEGMMKIQKSLSEASNGLKTANVSTQAKKTDQLLQGTQTINSSIGMLSDGLSSIESGMKKGENGANRIKDGAVKLENSSKELSTATSKLTDGYQSLYEGLYTLQDKYETTTNSLKATIGLVNTIEVYAKQLAQDQPVIQTDPAYKKLMGATQQLDESLNQIANGLTTLNDKYTVALQSLNSANQSLIQVENGQRQIITASASLSGAAATLRDGLGKSVSGQMSVISQMPNLQTGLNQLSSGQKAMQNGLESLGTSLNKLQSGLNNSANGLGKVNSGIGSTMNYLNQLGNSNTNSYFAPEEALKNVDFKKGMNSYLSKDKKIAKWTIILNDNPYSANAINTVKQINKNVGNLLKGTDFKNARFGATGVSANNAALSQINKDDFTKTVFFMLIGIGLILMLMFRSILLPVYVVISLVLAYFSSVNITESFYEHVFGQPGLSWAVPFFSFTLIIALGVDYSIFLLMRFKEYHDEDPKAAIVKAMTQMGSVIISAVIILMGTFGALYPSNVVTLIQLATVVIIGLVILVLILLPLFIPALMALTIRKKKTNEEMILNV